MVLIILKQKECGMAVMIVGLTIFAFLAIARLRWIINKNLLTN